MTKITQKTIPKSLLVQLTHNQFVCGMVKQTMHCKQHTVSVSTTILLIVQFQKKSVHVPASSLQGFH